MNNSKRSIVFQCAPRNRNYHVPMFSSNAIIIYIWSYGGLRSSPLSRNWELMQRRNARIGYLKLGVICKCWGWLALTKRGRERNLPIFLLYLSRLSPSPTFQLSDRLSFSLPPFGTGLIQEGTNNLCNTLRYVFLLLLQREFFFPFPFFLFLFSILLIHLAVPTNK